MGSLRRRTTLAGVLAVAAVGLLAAPAAASHDGAILDCGDAGTFTLRATPNGAGFQAPLLGGVILFEEGGVLVPQLAIRDGVVQWAEAVTGRAANAVEETTCTFTIATGYWEITGVMTRRGSPTN